MLNKICSEKFHGCSKLPFFVVFLFPRLPLAPVSAVPPTISVYPAKRGHIGDENSSSRGKDRSRSRGKDRSRSRGKDRSRSRGKDRSRSRGKGSLSF